MSAKKAPFKLILCDLGNVLVNFDHRIAVRRIQPFTQRTFEDIYQLFFDSPLIKDFEEGRLASPDFFDSLKQELGLKDISFDTFSSIWNEIFFANEDILEVLKGLRKNYKLYLLSNINEMHYKYICDRFPDHMKVFDKIYLSYEVGRRKPHQDIYLKPMKEAGVSPEEVLYIDDRADLIAEAKKLGIKAILFKDVDFLKKELKKMKVAF